MIRYKLLAVAISVVVVFVQEVTLIRAEGAETKEEVLSEHSGRSDIFRSKTTISSVSHTVTASVYFPEPEQTDSTPFITADGSVINEKDPGGHRWIAVSRDLLSRWGGEINYGDSIQVKGISDELDGLYIVRDTMHRRIRNRIDILVGRKDDVYGFWDNIQITKVN